MAMAGETPTMFLASLRIAADGGEALTKDYYECFKQLRNIRVRQGKTDEEINSEHMAIEEQIGIDLMGSKMLQQKTCSAHYWVHQGILTFQSELGEYGVTIERSSSACSAWPSAQVKASPEHAELRARHEAQLKEKDGKQWDAAEAKRRAESAQKAAAEAKLQQAIEDTAREAAKIQQAEQAEAMRVAQQLEAAKIQQQKEDMAREAAKIQQAEEPKKLGTGGSFKGRDWADDSQASFEIDQLMKEAAQKKKTEEPKAQAPSWLNAQNIIKEDDQRQGRHSTAEWVRLDHQARNPTDGSRAYNDHVHKLTCEFQDQEEAGGFGRFIPAKYGPDGLTRVDTGSTENHFPALQTRGPSSNSPNLPSRPAGGHKISMPLANMLNQNKQTQDSFSNKLRQPAPAQKRTATFTIVEDGKSVPGMEKPHPDEELASHEAMALMWRQDWSIRSSIKTYPDCAMWEVRVPLSSSHLIGNWANDAQEVKMMRGIMPSPTKLYAARSGNWVYVGLYGDKIWQSQKTILAFVQMYMLLRRWVRNLGTSKQRLSDAMRLWHITMIEYAVAAPVADTAPEPKTEQGAGKGDEEKTETDKAETEKAETEKDAKDAKEEDATKNGAKDNTATSTAEQDAAQTTGTPKPQDEKSETQKPTESNIKKLRNEEKLRNLFLDEKSSEKRVERMMEFVKDADIHVPEPRARAKLVQEFVQREFKGSTKEMGELKQFAAEFKKLYGEANAQEKGA